MVSQLAGSIGALGPGGPDFGGVFPAAGALGDSALAGFAKIPFKYNGLYRWLAGLELLGFGEAGSTWYCRRQNLGPEDHHFAFEMPDLAAGRDQNQGGSGSRGYSEGDCAGYQNGRLARPV
jgi:hypothetical protein